jgi:hypothetical protein
MKVMCKQCGKTFKSKQGVIVHVSRTHKVAGISSAAEEVLLNRSHTADSSVATRLHALRDSLDHASDELEDLQELFGL